MYKSNFITGQNEREQTTQNTTVTKSAACASYKSNYVTYITATYTRAYVYTHPNMHAQQRCKDANKKYKHEDLYVCSTTRYY
jgi:hypothetical protein